MYCIYRITNLINGKTYIGKHKYTDESNPMRKYKGSGVLLHKAYKKYGIENFKTEILYSRVRDKATIDAMEIWSISKYKPEYNIAKGGEGCDYWKGKHLSEETKAKIASVNKGKKFSDETKAKMSAARKGKKRQAFSEEWRAKMSVAHKGKHWNLSDETKAKLSASHKGKHWKLVDGKRVWY